MFSAALLRASLQLTRQLGVRLFRRHAVPRKTRQVVYDLRTLRTLGASLFRASARSALCCAVETDCPRLAEWVGGWIY